MDSYELLDPQELIRLALGELRAANTTPELPKEKRNAIEERINRAEAMLAVARSKSAKELGYRLHDCKYPPALLLWDESRQAHICEHCGHIRSKPTATRVSETSSWIRARRGGGDGWMG